MYGGKHDDKIMGGAGKDKMFGGSGDDTLIGGTGKDIMKGGAGADTFVFMSTKHSDTGSKSDVVYFDDEDGDEIDLRGIDACEDEAGNQSFDWIGGNGFSGEQGELRFKSGVLRGDVDGDGKADFAITIEGTLWLDDILV